ncbi:hypothetical protein SELMODRAFT_403907 [Selaginella moellendorffii]|uniref:Ubiquitin-like protease family profile domain-containing protein n=1 Tax=Selaginella moellendorffii TaxID=88036 RepID=D8QSY3_SELML|nr:hypothetical protein SELMODRAFT_403907 [Selaginella moellendorffii]
MRRTNKTMKKRRTTNEMMGMTLKRMKMCKTRSFKQSLNADGMINDMVINFFILNLNLKQGQHIFNSFFYSYLCQKEYEKIRKWKNHLNIFEKKCLLLPVFKAADQTSIFHLDSMHPIGHDSSEIFKTIREYLESEWRYYNGGKPMIKIGIKKLKSNVVDCGVYMMHFMETFIQKSPDNLMMEFVDKMLFSNKIILRRRIRYEILKAVASSANKPKKVLKVYRRYKH